MRRYNDIFSCHVEVDEQNYTLESPHGCQTLESSLFGFRNVMEDLNMVFLFPCRSILTSTIQFMILLKVACYVSEEIVHVAPGSLAAACDMPIRSRD